MLCHKERIGSNNMNATLATIWLASRIAKAASIKGPNVHKYEEETFKYLLSFLLKHMKRIGMIDLLSQSS